MNNHLKIILYIILLVSISFTQTRKEKTIIDFIFARYNANIDSIAGFLDEEFIYYHIPYVGLGINTVKTDSGLAVTSVSPFSNNKDKIMPGDVIYKVNSIKYNNIKNYNIETLIKGFEGDSVIISYIRNNNGK